MSVSRNTYLGPYFRCRTRTETVTVNVEACANPSCSLRGVARRSIPFCSQCGWAIDRAFPVDEARTLPDRWDVREAIDEALSEVTGDDEDFPEDFGHHLWIPNASRPGGPERADADSSCGVEIPLDGVDDEAEKRWMSTAYPEWSTLVQLYGGGNCEVRWGLLRWCS